MIQHLSNCHGEWNLLLAFVGSLPFLGIWLKSRLQALKREKEDESR